MNVVDISSRRATASSAPPVAGQPVEARPVSLPAPPRERRPSGPVRAEALLGLASRHFSPTPAAARAAIIALARRTSGGTLVLKDARGSLRLGRGPLSAEVCVHDDRAYTAVLARGSVGLGQGYVAGWWSSPDLTALVRVLYRWTQGLRLHLDRAAAVAAPALDALARRRAPRPEDDRRNIASHYDLSNRFFEVMLGASMAYSCAVFAGPTTSLDAAQEAKFARLCAKASLRPEDSVLEVGTGWGGFALYAARHFGCRVTTTTISAEQRRYAEEAVKAAGLSHLVTVIGDDWRELRGRYDKLVSVEMVEAVDWRLHDDFLRKCSDLLHPAGKAVFQAIVMDDASFERAKRHQDFVRKMVFPGGCIPSVSSLVRSARSTDLRLVDLEDIGRHYARTLRLWSDNIGTRGDELARLGAGQDLLRLWSLYLAYCEASFLERHISDVQMVFVKPGWRGALEERPA